MDIIKQLYSKSQLPSLLITTLFLSLSFLTYFGSVDKISPQWVYLSLITILCLSYYSLNNISHINLFRDKIYISFLVFVFFCFFSLFFSNNFNESLIVFSRWIIILSSFYCLIISVSYFKPTFLQISSIISVILLLELSYSLSPLFDILSVSEFSPNLSVYLKGVTGNKNITSSIFAMKIPFVYYVLYRSKNFAIKLSAFLLIFLTLFLLFFLSTRGILISIILLYFIFPLVYFFVKSTKKSFLVLVSFYLPLLFSLVFYNLTISKNSNFKVDQRITSVFSPSESSVNARLRYYKNATDQIISSPFIGLGLGNWKIKSIQYDKDNIVGYTVPYNAHNDLLEFGAEIGVLGLVSYLVFFFSLVYRAVSFFIKDRSNLIPLVLLYVMFIYFVDLNLNFPTYRPVAHIVFIFVASMVINLNYFTNENKL